MNCDADQFECIAGDCKYSDNNNCNGPCIKSSWVNDGEPDCTDGSDEENFDEDDLAAIVKLPGNTFWCDLKNYSTPMCYAKEIPILRRF